MTLSDYPGFREREEEYKQTRASKFYETNFPIQTYNHNLNLLDHCQLSSSLCGFLDLDTMST